MLYHNVHIFGRYLRLVDAATVGISAILVWSTGVRYHLWEPATGYNAFIFATALVVSFVVLAGQLHIYHARRTEGIIRELAPLLNVVLCATGTACLSAELLTIGLPRQLYLAILLVNLSVLLGLRVSIRFFLRWLRREGQDSRIWLLIGRNNRSAKIAQQILANPHFGVHIAQVVDLPDDLGRRTESHTAAFRDGPLASLRQSVVADANSLRDILAEGIIDEVVVSLPIRSFYDGIQQILKLCGEAGISVKFPPEAFERTIDKTEVVHVGDIPLVTHYSGPGNYSSLFAKRLLDMMASGIALLALLPFHLIIAVAIKLTSKGPVFFRQTRVGLHGRQFRMVKFRTMIPNAPHLRTELAKCNEQDGPAFKMKGDPRITGIGRWLRKYHFDELPQLWNVLVGDMSLVGPRPLPPEEARGADWCQRRRLSMPPGLTCLWQVAGDHKISFERWMQLDLEYIDRWSLMLDFRLMAATFGTVVRGSGW